MFERFTERARKVMALANQEAFRLEHDYIRPEHILIGLAREGSGIGAKSLKNLGIEPRSLLLEVEKLLEDESKTHPVAKLGPSDSTKQIIQYAVEEASNLAHDHVGTEHLLLGILREGKGITAEVLLKFNLRLEHVRDEILSVAGQRRSDD